MTQTEVHTDPAQVAAEKLVEVAGRGGHVAVAGGSTPREAYRRAAAAGRDWSGAHVWFGDERCVGADAEHSNFRMVSESLLDALEGPQPTVHRMAGELGPHEGARAYEAELREAFGGEDVPTLDLVLLGLGPDAHTASLFPHDAALEQEERWVTGVDSPGMAPLVPRITLTLPAINAAREVVFLVAGADKADAVTRAFSGPPDPGAPASLVAPRSGALTVLLDDAAAARLAA